MEIIGKIGSNRYSSISLRIIKTSEGYAADVEDSNDTSIIFGDATIIELFLPLIIP